MKQLWQIRKTSKTKKIYIYSAKTNKFRNGGRKEKLTLILFDFSLFGASIFVYALFNDRRSRPYRQANVTEGK